jgi:signal peptidase I
MTEPEANVARAARRRSRHERTVMSAPSTTLARRQAARAGNAAALIAWLYLSVLVGLTAWVGLGSIVFHWRPVVMTSGSMAPGFAPGDVVLLSDPGTGRLAEGSVVAFKRDGAIVTHRVDDAVPDGTYVTQGDANHTPDPHRLTDSEVEGVGRLVVPYIGRPLLWRHHGDAGAFQLWVVLTLLAGVLAGGPLLRSRRRRAKADAAVTARAHQRRSSDATPGVGAALRRLRGLAGAVLVLQVAGMSDLPVPGWTLAVAIALLVAAVNVLSLAAQRAAHTRWATSIGVVELAVDAAITLFIVTELLPASDSIMWALLVVPVLEGALRHRLRGAVLTWAAVSALYLVHELSPVTVPGGLALETAFLGRLQDVVQRIGVVLLVAVPGAYLSEQLVRAIAGQRRAKQAATDRGQLLERVVEAGRRINRLGGEVVGELTRAGLELGFNVVDVCRRDHRDGTWTVVARAGDEDIELPHPGGEGGAADAAWDGRSTIVVGGGAMATVTAVVAVPLRGPEGAVAVLRAGLTAPAASTQVECLELLAGQAGVALRNSTLLGQLQEAHERLEHQAFHDALTGLPNRELFSQRLSAALEAVPTGRKVAVMFLDLDRFKEVNDTLGHEVGDELLVAVAGRLSRAVRAGTLVARIGGDEFTVLMPAVDRQVRTETLAERFCEALSKPFRLGSNEVCVSTSVGIALSSAEVSDAGELMRRADVAMYKAKSRGPANWQVWSPDLDGAASERMQMEAELRRAVERGELVLAYQPIGTVRDGRITGVEALVRWSRGDRGMVGPDDFIPLAEDSGIIVELGRWVLEEACARGAQWASALSGRRFTMSVNVSPRQLARPGFLSDLERILTETGLDPRSLVLEMTERVLAGEESRDLLKRVRDLGVRIAIDDFGQGQASMSYLKRFQVDILKIDKSFVHGSTGEARDSAILKSMITLAHDLGIQVVAEGVESAEQVQQLRALGCDAMQGYYFQVPLLEDDANTLLLKTRGRPQRVIKARRRETAEVGV